MSGKRVKHHLATFVVGLAVALAAVPAPAGCDCAPVAASLSGVVAPPCALAITVSPQLGRNACCPAAEGFGRHIDGVCPCGLACPCEVARTPDQPAVPSSGESPAARGINPTPIVGCWVGQELACPALSRDKRSEPSRLSTSLFRCISLSRFLL